MLKKKENNFKVIIIAGPTASGKSSLAIDLAKTCDNTKLILNHCGVPDIAGGNINPWKKNITELSKLSNDIKYLIDE